MTLNLRTNTFRRQLRSSSAIAALILMGLCCASGSSLAAVDKSLPNGQMSAESQREVAKLLGLALDAMKNGHPEVAVIHLKNAETIAPGDTTINMNLGEALLGAGNPAEAARELRSAIQRGAPQAKVLPMLYQAMLAQRQGQQLLNEFAEPSQDDHSELAADTLRARAYAQVQLGQKDEAAATLDRALAISRSARNLTARAQLAHDAGDDALAAKFVDEALAKEPANPSALMIKVTLLQLANKADQALGFADTLVKETHNSSLARMARAGVYMQLKQDAKALPDLNAVLAATPNLSQAIFYKAGIRARAKDVKGAWNLAQTLPPGFLRSRVDIAIAVSQMAIDAGHREIGTSILSSAVQTFPDSADARVRMGLDYLVINETQRAIDTLKPLQDSSDSRALMLLGQAYAKQGKFTDSLKFFEKASATGFGGDILKQQVANSNLQAGSVDRAADEFSQLFAKQPGNAETAGPLIAALLRQGKVDAAFQVADKLNTAAPKSPYGPLYQGQLLAQKGDVDQAIAAFSTAIARDPKFLPARYDRAVALATRGDLQAASADLQTVLAADPKNAMVMIKQAQIAAQTGQDAKVLELLKKAVAANPKDTVPNLALVDYFVRQRKPADAQAVLASFLRASPNNANAVAMLGSLQLDTGATDQAIKTFQKLQKMNSKAPQAQILLGDALAKKGDVAGAADAYQNAVRLDPSLSSSRASLIRFYLSTKNETAALAAAQEFAANQPGPVSAQALAGTLVATNKPDQAEKVLTASQAKTPSGTTLLPLTGLLRKRGQSKKADDMLVAWLAKHPTDATIRSAYAQSQLVGNPATAEQQFRAVLKEEPYNLSALNNLAWLLREKNSKEALVYAQRAQKLAPHLPAVLDTLGWVKWQLNDRAGALAMLRQARAGNKDDPEIVYHLAVALNESGQQAEAKSLLATLHADALDFTDKDKARALSARLK